MWWQWHEGNEGTFKKKNQKGAKKLQCFSSAKAQIAEFHQVTW